MKNLLYLGILSTLSFSCKPTYTADDLPKPFPSQRAEGERASTMSPAESDEMENLKTEITVLAESDTCTDAAAWKAVGLGIKPCGGSVKYIAYSNKIDEKAFLDKVSLYNKKSDEYNKKYNLVSDCIVVMPPANIVCENGKPVFK